MDPLADVRRFVRPGLVRADAGPGGLPRLTVTSALGRCEVLTHGAHVTAWEPAGCAPVVWMTGQARFEPGVPIRGGVPICWPWFGPAADPDLPMHGPVRTIAWSVEDLHVDADGTARIALSCSSARVPPRICAHAFSLRYVVTMRARTLDLSLRATNDGTAPIPVAEALHAYLAIGDVRRVSIDGLGGTEFVDRSETHGFHLRRPHPRGRQEGEVSFAEEVDRHHIGHDGEVLVRDQAWNRTLRIAKRGSRSTQVWNPWIGKAARLPDLGDHEWPGFVAIEAANAFDEAYELAPGASHELAQTIEVL